MRHECQKHRHKTKRSAADHLGRIKDHHPYSEGHVYWCGECKGFHVGRKLATVDRRSELTEEPLTERELLDYARTLAESLKAFSETET